MNARELLAEADVMIAAGLHRAAGRNSYLAAFHSVQALIFELTRSVAKTHRGVQAEFARLTRDDGTLNAELRGFLGRAYNLKTTADYEIGFATLITAEEARNALEFSRRFVDWVETNGLIRLGSAG